jgi:hypothetical protein
MKMNTRCSCSCFKKVPATKQLGVGSRSDSAVGHMDGIACERPPSATISPIGLIQRGFSISLAARAAGIGSAPPLSKTVSVVRWATAHASRL